MATDDKFDFNLDELATEQETAQDEELRKQIQKSAGNILATVRKLANKGDIDNLRRIERALTDTPEPRRSRDDRETRSRQQPTPPAAPATEEPAADETHETKPKGRLAKLADRFNQ